MPFAADSAGDISLIVESLDRAVKDSEHDSAFRTDGPMHSTVAFQDVHARGIANMGRVVIVETAFQYQALDGSYMAVRRCDAFLFKPNHEGKASAGRIGAQQLELCTGHGPWNPREQVGIAGEERST